MLRFHREVRAVILAVVACMFAGGAIAQTTIVAPVRRVNFDSPDGWALQYFTSATMLSGLQPPQPLGEHARFGAVTLGVELGWLRAVRPGQAANVFFRGPSPDNLNRAPIVIRPVVRVGLLWRFTAVAAIPPPLEAFSIRPRLFAFGLERPILERKQWTLGWRASGQVGSVKGDYTCPQSAAAFPVGSPNNLGGCLAASKDVASLRYGGTEVQFAYRLRTIPKLSPHVSAGMNWIDADFRIDAQLQNHVDHTQLWTRGKTFSSTAGVSYMFTNRMSFTVDGFYSPLWVRRSAAGPRTIEGLFNVRALINYTLR